MSWYGFMDRRLAGKFDDLPNAGQPLDVSENVWLAPEWRLAFKILKDNQIVPEFIERRKEIETIHAEMKRLRAEHGSRLAYREQVEKLAAAVEALGKALVREGDFVRSSLQLPPVDIDSEMREADLKKNP